MSFVPKDITTLSTVLSNTLDLASFIVSSIFSNVAPEIEAFMQLGENFPSLLQLEAPSKTFTEFLSFVVRLLSACPDVSLRSVSSIKLELSRVFLLWYCYGT